MSDMNQKPMISPLLPPSWLIQEDMTAQYYSVLDTQLPEVIETLLALESRLVWLFCTDDSNTEERLRLWYVFELLNNPQFLVLVVNTNNPVSIAQYYPAASRFERVISDGFGIRFAMSLDERRLFLHEWYPDGFHPMRKTTANVSITPNDSPVSYEFRQVEGAGVYQIPVGPVHAGIIEPGHFRFSVIGETILNLEIRLGYLHRGIEKLAEGKEPAGVVRIAESIGGDESVCNSCCYAMAVEHISSVRVPDRAVFLRGILLELERSYSLLSDLAGMVTDVAFSASASRFLIIREELQQVSEQLSGSRFLKGMIRIGGISQDISEDFLSELKDTIMKTTVDLKSVLSWTKSVPSVIDRFETTGVVREPLIDPLSLSGPVARASGRALDVRMNHPYGIYSAVPPKQISEKAGDVMARFSLKGDEVLASFAYMKKLITDIPQGPVMVDSEIKDGYALATVESPRGRTLIFVQIKNSQVDRLCVSTASFCNWMALEHAVMGNIVADFPVINKSLNLSYAGTDL